MSRLSQMLRALLRKARFRLTNRNFQPYVSPFTYDGATYQFYVGDAAGETWFKGGWDWTEIGEFTGRLVEPGDVVFDCGAHHGEMMLVLAHEVGPEGHVVSFEPVPRNAEIIRQQIALNDLTNVTFHHAAVGSEAGQLRITDESNAQIVAAGTGIDVPVLRLDDFAHLEPDVIKIDVEGFEAEVLKGAQELLKRRPKIALELHTTALPRYGTSIEEVLALVHADTYDWTLQYSGSDAVRPWQGEPFEPRIAHLFGLPKA